MPITESRIQTLQRRLKRFSFPVLTAMLYSARYVTKQCHSDARTTASFLPERHPSRIATLRRCLLALPLVADYRRENLSRITLYLLYRSDIDEAMFIRTEEVFFIYPFSRQMSRFLFSCLVLRYIINFRYLYSCANYVRLICTCAAVRAKSCVRVKT